MIFDNEKKVFMYHGKQVGQVIAKRDTLNGSEVTIRIQTMDSDAFLAELEGINSHAGGQPTIQPMVNLMADDNDKRYKEALKAIALIDEELKDIAKANKALKERKGIQPKIRVALTNTLEESRVKLIVRRTELMVL